MRGWTIRDSADLYGVSHWGAPYFSVSDRGTVVVHPRGEGGPSIDLLDLVKEIRRRGLGTPLLIRFSDILARRIEFLSSNFTNAIREYGYRGAYRPVYPIKVNQQRQIVEEIVEYGRGFNMGLEAGSKPELLVALALLDNPDALIVCNGYKDRAYLEPALLAQRLGRTPMIVLDRPTELDVLIKLSRELDVRPHIGVRTRLAARGAGKWVESSGDRSKFGLSAAEIVAAVDRLRAEDMLDCLEMLHFHQGSQITDIRSHKEALREAVRIFVGLRELGAPVRYINVGGGLGVDYDGSQTNFHSSMNYSTQEYAHDVVAAIAEGCDERGIEHPDIVTEAGRALVAHASVLVFDVLGTSAILDGTPTSPPEPPGAGDHRVLHDLHEVYGRITRKNALESYHDALQLKEEAVSLFNLGYVDLAARARAEDLFWRCCLRIMFLVREMDYVPEDLEGLERSLADIYYGNFSVFQSMPDSWTVKQLFPIMPLHRLEERPTRRGVFADLTCDSDGKVDQFIDRRDVRHVLELHAPNGEPYYCGVFLIGAYQETLGEVHNLFGDTDTVHVRVADDGRYRIEQVIEGETVSDVLSYVQYDRRMLLERVRQAIERAVDDQKITLDEAALLRRRYTQALEGYTYLEREE
jgi:arginine decarboxylase